MAYYLRIQGKTFGPLNHPEMLQLKQKGKLKPFHEVSTDQVDWFSASTYAELFPQATVQSNDVPIGVYQVDVSPVVPDKNYNPAPPNNGNSGGAFAHIGDLALATMMTAIAVIMHFVNIQLQFGTITFSLPFQNNMDTDHVILVVITVFSLLVMFGLFIVGAVFFMKASQTLYSSGFAISFLILMVLALIFFLASAVTFSAGKTPDTLRVGFILSILGSISYYSAFAVITFLYNRAFETINRPGLAYSSHLLAFALVGAIFLFSLSSFVNAFMMNSHNDMAKVYWVSSVIALEMLGLLQIFLVWFLYHTFALRFYLTRILTGKA
jgi:hypothetical protein